MEIPIGRVLQDLPQNPVMRVEEIVPLLIGFMLARYISMSETNRTRLLVLTIASTLGFGMLYGAIDKNPAIIELAHPVAGLLVGAILGLLTRDVRFSK